MARKRSTSLEMKSVLFIDAVNFTQELKEYERALITAKINQLREFAEFFFIYKLKGKMIGELGDGFLILCPPEPHKVLNEAFAFMGFIKAYNFRKEAPAILNVRLTLHYGLIAPPEGNNYIDSNINLTARLEGETPPNCICVSSVVHDIVADTLRHFRFDELSSVLKGFGQSRFFLVSSPTEIIGEPSRDENRLGFYLSTIDALRRVPDWKAVRETCKQALQDFTENPEFMYQLGFASMFLKQYKDAITAFESCVQVNYHPGDCLNFIGSAYRLSNDKSQALAHFMKAIEREPDHFHAMMQLAEMYLQDEQYDDAWELSHSASKLAPMFYAPRAMLIALVILRKKSRSVQRLIRGVPAYNRGLFRTKIEQHLKYFGSTNHRLQLDEAFDAVYGAVKPQLQTQKQTLRSEQLPSVRESNKKLKRTR